MEGCLYVLGVLVLILLLAWVVSSGVISLLPMVGG